MNGESFSPGKFESVLAEEAIQRFCQQLENGRRFFYVSPEEPLYSMEDTIHKMASEYASGAVILQGAAGSPADKWQERGPAPMRVELYEGESIFDALDVLYALKTSDYLPYYDIDRTSISFDGETHRISWTQEGSFVCNHRRFGVDENCPVPYEEVA